MNGTHRDIHELTRSQFVEEYGVKNSLISETEYLQLRCQTQPREQLLFSLSEVDVTEGGVQWANSENAVVTSIFMRLYTTAQGGNDNAKCTVLLRGSIVAGTSRTYRLFAGDEVSLDNLSDILKFEIPVALVDGTCIMQLSAHGYVPATVN